MEDNTLSRGQAFALRFQQFLGRIFLLPLGYVVYGLLRFRGGYKIENHREVRRQFRELSKSGRPLLICPNHLTMIDSVIIMWAIGSIPFYLSNYRLLSWNIPAIENYRNKIVWRVVTYLSKCIAINRAGGVEHIEGILTKLSYLLGKGEVVTIFPEGTRSRTGQIDVASVTYGMGRMVQSVPNCDVLCVYLRGHGQDSYSTYPKKGEVIHLEMELFTPQTKLTGLRAHREISIQTITRLKQMEERYFAKLNAAVPSVQNGSSS